MRELFGPVDPVPPERLQPLSDGDVVHLGDRSIDVLYTPGHASHHISLVDSETGAIFTGDALGIHLPGVRVLRPATPPPDVDVELAVGSIERIWARARSVLMFSHYGPVSEVEELCRIAIERVKKWADIVKGAMDVTIDLDRIAEILAAGTAAEFEGAATSDPSELERYEILSSMRVNAAGLVRYWQKREETQRGAAREGPRPRLS